MSCEGCVQKIQAQIAERQAVEKLAQLLANEKQINVIIYQDPVNGYQYMEEEAARTAGISPERFITPRL